MVDALAELLGSQIISGDPIIHLSRIDSVEVDGKSDLCGRKC